MKLKPEIKRLNRRPLFRNERLKSACHEASHGIAAWWVEIPFTRIECGCQTVNAKVLANSEAEHLDISGRMVADKTYKIYKDRAVAAALVALAGYAYEQIVNPHDNKAQALTSAGADYRQAVEWLNYAQWVLPSETDKHIDEVLVPFVRNYLIQHWNTVLRVGRALSERGSLTQEQVKELTQ